jgi:ammonia channel protein AmtB
MYGSLHDISGVPYSSSSSENTSIASQTTVYFAETTTERDTFSQNVLGIVLGAIAGLILISFSAFCLYKHFKKPNKVATANKSDLNQQEMKTINN